ncbi:MAG: MBL fold metallo-hydrolase [Peptococcaceae bacterium]|nr:MBL fold metallo-hydrolase [Peptococcaceae bacterium]
MLEKILPNLYRLEIPLPNNPLKAVNSYVIKAPGRNLIIDTGMNREECLSAMRSGLEQLGVDLKKTDFFITHMHADHSGLVAELSTENSLIYSSAPDADMICPPFSPEEFLRRITELARMAGFPEKVLQKAILQHPGFKYRPRGNLDFRLVKDGDTVDAGDYTFTCVETPGHTKGHMCLYEPRKKILLSGDHILDEITPNISTWMDEGNPLQEYIASLDKVYALDIDIVLPGHRQMISNCRRRIRELKQHHRERTEEVLSILKHGDRNPYQVASEMSWDMTYDSWDLFPAPQKWFATGEAIAHLKYLEEERLIKKVVRDRKVMYCLGA